MYTGYGFKQFGIGDVDILKVGDLFHLFHLILPNHDYIAHAVSRDGLNWRRVENALFVGHPGAWDDDMLWTMHVSKNPYREGWRMFYTGLARRERGRIQRVGVAHSDDLYHWHKRDAPGYPIATTGAPYEARLDEGRQWISFRDPAYHRVDRREDGLEGGNGDGEGYLLVAGRVNHGPVIRRGCVALLREVAEDQFEFLPPLFHPHRYDDVEVPSIVTLAGRHYLLGSIREDVKVHYWYAERFEGPYLNFSDNVLLPQGNYAARVCRDGDRYLVWNFFFKGLTTSGDHMLPPPKELVVDPQGELRLTSFYGFDQQVTQRRDSADLTPLRPLLATEGAVDNTQDASCWFGANSGFEVFLLRGEVDNFRLSGRLAMDGRGKCGLVARLDDKGDGYYLSLDLQKGIAQLRAWGTTAEGLLESAFEYTPLQAAYYPCRPGPVDFTLLAYGKYLEFSLGGYILLTLADDRYSRGGVGFYVESAKLKVDNLRLETLTEPVGEDYAEVT